MPGLLADNDVIGHLRAIVAVCQTSPWEEFWDNTEITVYDFDSLGIRRDIPDAELWRLCQLKGIVLVTGNRNQEGPLSLESIIRNEAKPFDLPVFTLADPDRILKDRIYTTEVEIRLLEFLFDLENVRGAGRLYLP